MIKLNIDKRRNWLGYFSKLATEKDAKGLQKINRRALNKAFPKGDEQDPRAYNQELNELALEGPYFSKPVIKFISNLDQHVGPAENRKGFIRWVANLLQNEFVQDAGAQESKRFLSTLTEDDLVGAKVGEIEFIKDWAVALGWPDIEADMLDDMTFSSALRYARDWHEEEAFCATDKVDTNGQERPKRVEHRFPSGYKIVYEPLESEDPIARRKLGNDLNICLQSGHYRDNTSGEIYSLRGSGNPGKAHVCIRRKGSTILEIKVKNNQPVWKVEHAKMLDVWFKKDNVDFGGAGRSDYNAFPPTSFEKAYSVYERDKKKFYRNGYFRAFRGKFANLVEQDLDEIFSSRQQPDDLSIYNKTSDINTHWQPSTHRRRLREGYSQEDLGNERKEKEKINENYYYIDLFESLIAGKAHHVYMMEVLKYIEDIAINFPYIYFDSKLYRTYSARKKKTIRLAATALFDASPERFHQIYNNSEHEEIKDILEEFVSSSSSLFDAVADLRIHAPGGHVDETLFSDVVSSLSVNAASTFDALMLAGEDSPPLLEVNYFATSQGEDVELYPNQIKRLQDRDAMNGLLSAVDGINTTNSGSIFNTRKRLRVIAPKQNIDIDSIIYKIRTGDFTANMVGPGNQRSTSDLTTNAWIKQKVYKWSETPDILTPGGKLNLNLFGGAAGGVHASGQKISWRYEAEIIRFLLLALEFIDKAKDPDLYQKIIRALEAHGGPWNFESRKELQEVILRKRLYKDSDILLSMVRDRLAGLGWREDANSQTGLEILEDLEGGTSNARAPGSGSPSREAFESRGFIITPDPNGEIRDGAGRFNVSMKVIASEHRYGDSPKDDESGEGAQHPVDLQTLQLSPKDTVTINFSAYDIFGTLGGVENLAASRGATIQSSDEQKTFRGMVKDFFKHRLHLTKEFRPHLDSIAEKFIESIKIRRSISWTYYGEDGASYSVKKLLASNYVSEEKKERLISAVAHFNTTRSTWWGGSSEARFLLAPSFRSLRNNPRSESIIDDLLKFVGHFAGLIAQGRGVDVSSDYTPKDFSKIFAKYKHQMSEGIFDNFKRCIAKLFLESGYNLRRKKEVLKLVPEIKGDPKIELDMLISSLELSKLKHSPHKMYDEWISDIDVNDYHNDYHDRWKLDQELESISKNFRYINGSDLAKNIIIAAPRINSLVNNTNTILTQRKLYSGQRGKALEDIVKLFFNNPRSNEAWYALSDLGSDVMDPLGVTEGAKKRAAEARDFFKSAHVYSVAVNHTVNAFAKLVYYYFRLSRAAWEAADRFGSGMDQEGLPTSLDRKKFNMIGSYFRNGMHKIFDAGTTNTIKFVLENSFGLYLSSSAMGSWKLFEDGGFSSLLLDQVYRGTSRVYAEYGLYEQDEGFIESLKSEVEKLWRKFKKDASSLSASAPDTEEFEGAIWDIANFVLGFMWWGIDNLPEEFDINENPHIDLYSVDGDFSLDEEPNIIDEPTTIRQMALKKYSMEMPSPDQAGGTLIITLGGSSIEIDNTDSDSFTLGYNFRGSLETAEYPMSSRPVPYIQEEVDEQTIKGYEVGEMQTPEDIIDIKDQMDLVFDNNPDLPGSQYDQRFMHDFHPEQSWLEGEDFQEEVDKRDTLEQALFGPMFRDWTGHWDDAAGPGESQGGAFADEQLVSEEQLASGEWLDPREPVIEDSRSRLRRRVIDNPLGFTNEEDLNMEDNINRKAWLKRMSRLTKLAARRKNIKINLPPYFKTWLRDRLIAQGEIDFRMEERMQFSLTMKYLGELPESAQRAILNDFQNMRGSKIEISTPEENIEVDIADEPARRNRRGSIKDLISEPRPFGRRSRAANQLSLFED